MRTKPLKTTCINITQDEHDQLVKESTEKSLSMSELLRRILDDYFETKKKPIE